MAVSYHLSDYDSEDYHAACQLREEVLRKPLEMLLRPVDIAQDQSHIHIIAKENDKVIGTLIIRPETPLVAALRQMAIATKAQGKGIGRGLLAYAEKHAANTGFQLLTLHARKTAEEFYARYGYEPKGEVFTEIGIPHIMMQKQLTGEDV